MIDGFPLDQVGVGSGWALVAFFVWLIFTGKLIPKSTHDRELDRSEHDGNEWRTEGRIKDQQLAEKDVQLAHAREVGVTVNAIMQSIGHNASSHDRISREGDI